MTRDETKGKQSKASVIRQMLKDGQTNRNIAEAVGCSQDYVRATKQRRDKGPRSSRLYALGDRIASRDASIKSYRDARLSGKSCADAKKVGRMAYAKTMIATGRSALINGAGVQS